MAEDRNDGQQPEDVVAEMAEIEDQLVADMAGEDSTVQIGDRIFELEVPSTKHVIWFINAFSRLVRRSQRVLADALGSPSPLDLVFSVGEALTEDDLIGFGVAALQFQNRQKGRKFLKDHGVPMPEIIQAVGISIKKSAPLVEQLKNVLESLVGPGTIEALMTTAVQDSIQ